ncbi:MAG: HAD family hydrolase [Cyanophyceae cyanobacterium]
MPEKDFKLIIFDKDWTLTKPASGGKFVQNPKGQVLLPGVQEKVKLLPLKGVHTAIASNQAGVEAGHKTLQEAIHEFRYAYHLTGIHLSLFCIDMDGEAVARIYPPSCEAEAEAAGRAVGDIKSRKPDPGMLLWIIAFYEACFPQSGSLKEWTLFVGDMESDRQAAIAAEVQFAWAKDYLSGRNPVGIRKS